MTSMIPLAHGGERVLVQRTTYDRFNDPTYTDHHYIDGVAIFTGFSTSGRISPNVETGNELMSSLTLYAPPHSDITAYDRIIRVPKGMTTVPPESDVQGKAIRKENAFQVLGNPMDWVNTLTGWAPGMEVALRRIS